MDSDTSMASAGGDLDLRWSHLSCGMTALPLVNESSQADLTHPLHRSPTRGTSFACRASTPMPDASGGVGVDGSTLMCSGPSGAAVQQILQRPDGWHSATMRATGAATLVDFPTCPSALHRT
jgi:hypothetical protein